MFPLNTHSFPFLTHSPHAHSFLSSHIPMYLLFPPSHISLTLLVPRTLSPYIFTLTSFPPQYLHIFSLHLFPLLAFLPSLVLLIPILYPPFFSIFFLLHTLLLHISPLTSSLPPPPFLPPHHSDYTDELYAPGSVISIYLINHHPHI